jgi:hypothetical protein
MWGCGLLFLFEHTIKSMIMTRSNKPAPPATPTIVPTLKSFALSSYVLSFLFEFDDDFGGDKR